MASPAPPVPTLRPSETAKEQLPIPGNGPPTSRDAQLKEKLGHRRIDEQGEVSYKKVPTNALMQAIQLGIANSIGSLASMPNRDLLLQDFEKIENVTFPANGSATTPVHSFGDFRFRTYAPIAFRYFRELFHIKTADFLKSICTEPLKELTNAGASGSIFYVSQDDQFIIKTVQHKEADFLQKLLPGYYMNLNQNPRTLLPKFFGLFCYQSLGKNIRLLVMNNLLPQTIPMHEKYDMKGSTYKRMAGKHERAKSHPTLKDLDFLENHRDGIQMDPAALEALIKTISRDCLVLESFKIMDYSLLIGIHNMDLGRRQRIESDDSTATGEDGAPTTSHGGEKKILQEKFSVWDTEDGEVHHGGVPARNSNGDHLILYLGIIDILQNYRLLKKMEHTWKAFLHDGDTISVHNPSFYANRFLSFMTDKVFKKGPALNKSPSRRRITRKSLGEEEQSPKDATSSAAAAATPSTVPADYVQSARESSYRGKESVSGPVSARDVVPILPGISRVPLRRSYRDGGGSMSVEKKEKKVERLFASSKQEEREPLREEETAATTADSVTTPTEEITRL